MIKIVFTGPESTGKTTLSEAIAKKYNATLLKEYARVYLNEIDRKYSQSDLKEIAEGQIITEQIASEKEQKLLVLDTDLITIKIWSEYKYKNCDDWIIKQVHKHTYDMYFLCYPDIPWEKDTLRENPNDREEIYKIYFRELNLLNRKFIEVKGNLPTRIEQVSKVIDKLLQSAKNQVGFCS